MPSKLKSNSTKTARILTVVLPLLYIIQVLITRDPDRIIFVSGPFSSLIFFIQWTSFIFGDWPLAVLSTALFLGLLGFILGIAIESLIRKKPTKLTIIVLAILALSIIIFLLSSGHGLNPKPESPSSSPITKTIELCETESPSFDAKQECQNYINQNLPGQICGFNFSEVQWNPQGSCRNCLITCY